MIQETREKESQSKSQCKTKNTDSSKTSHSDWSLICDVVFSGINFFESCSSFFPSHPWPQWEDEGEVVSLDFLYLILFQQLRFGQRTNIASEIERRKETHASL